MNFRLVVLAGSMAVAMVACSPRVKRIESTAINNKQRLVESEIRLRNLETSLAHVETRVAELNNRNYEVRTRKGQKTGMVIVPVAAPKPTPIASMSTSQANRVETGKNGLPAGRKVEPQEQSKTPVKVSPDVSGQKIVRNQELPKKEVLEAGPSGRLSAHSLSPDELALPPTEMPVLEAEKKVLPVTASDTKQARDATPNMSNGSAGMPSATTPNAEPAKTMTASPSSPEVALVPKGAPGRAQQGEETAYKAALNFARTGRSVEGIARFQEFLETYPTGKYAPNAKFWIGECLYSQGRYQDALNMYQAVNDSYPRHHKNADALLKAGMSLSRLGNAEGASQKFQELKQTFPHSEAAKRIR